MNKDSQPETSCNEQRRPRRRLEEVKHLLQRLVENEEHFKELTRLQRLLTSKGHRVDVCRASELNINLKHLEGQLQTELERLERVQQTEKDFHQLEKEFETLLKIATEQLSSQSNERGIIYQVSSLSLVEQSDCFFSSLKTVFDRLQQCEDELKKMIHLAERLTNEISREHLDALKESIASRQARLQTLFQTCQQARTNYEQQMKSEQKLNEELINLQDWFRRVMEEFTQPLELNLSLNHLHDLQQSLTVSHLSFSPKITERCLSFSLQQLTVSIDQRLQRVDPPNDRDLRERLEVTEKLKQQVKVMTLTRERSTFSSVSTSRVI